MFYLSLGTTESPAVFLNVLQIINVYISIFQVYFSQLLFRLQCHPFHNKPCCYALIPPTQATITLQSSYLWNQQILDEWENTP